VPEVNKIVYRPHPGFQCDFLQSPAENRLLGGEAGPGKSFILVFEAPYDWDGGAEAKKVYQIPGYTSLIVRRESTQMEKLKEIAYPLYTSLGFEWHGTPNNFYHHPKYNSRIYLRSLQYDDSYQQFQGWSIHDLRIDEITQFNRVAIIRLMSWVRVVGVEGVRPRVSGTANADGQGLDWVKKEWRINCPCEDCGGKNEVFWKDENGNVVDEKVPGLKTSWHFISAKKRGSYLEDSEKKAGKAGKYEASLSTIYGGRTSAGFRALGKGCWEVGQSSHFPEANKDYHLIPDDFLPRGNWVGIGGHDWATSENGDAFAYVRILVNEFKDVIVDDFVIGWGCTAKEQARKFLRMYLKCAITASGKDTFSHGQAGQVRSIADQFLQLGKTPEEVAEGLVKIQLVQSNVIPSALCGIVRAGLKAAIENRQGAIYIRNRCVRIFDDLVALRTDDKDKEIWDRTQRITIDWQRESHQYHFDAMHAFFHALTYAYHTPKLPPMPEHVSEFRKKSMERAARAEVQEYNCAYGM
jgi:hypothetical protein